MTFDLMEDHPQAIHHGKADAGEDEQKPGLRLDLLIKDPESIAALAAYPNGRGTRFVRTALRIGILALNKAQGRFDSESWRNEGDRLVRQDGELEKLMRTQIEQTERTLAETLTRHVGADSTLMQYLAPNRIIATGKLTVDYRDGREMI